MRRLFLVLLACSLAVPAWADPPPHAPAHGWRKKHDPYYLGYTGYKWPRDYGILAGRCDREAVGAVLGGVAGAAIGSAVSGREARAVAILAGTVLGAIVGAEIGRQMDEADRACFGHTLELAPLGRRVVWRNPAGIAYAVVPVRDFELDGRPCREFRSERIEGKRRVESTGRACRGEEGEWQIVQ